MNSAEYENLDAVERDHWYYSGKRIAVHHWLTVTGKPRADHTLLDCGAGTGLFAKEMEARCRVLVLDNHEESLRILRTRFRADQILSLAGDSVPLPDRSLDFITALDVLEHVPDDAAVVRGFARLLKPGGVAVITVPASMALWSEWDVGLHHFRRYNRPQLTALFAGPAWEIVHVNYTNVVVYPLVWLVRRTLGLRKKLGLVSTARAEDRVPPALLNTPLRAIFAGLAKWRVPFPFGVSLLLVARRRDG
jgi:SAM-dependent methyltransferase